MNSAPTVTSSNMPSRIVSVDVVLVDSPPITPAYVWRKGLPGSDGDTVGAWLVITVESGIRGYAFTPRGVVFKDIVERRLRAELIGHDAFSRELLWQRVWEMDRVEQIPLHLFGLVDVALWDIGAKLAGLPLHKFLGGYRDAIPAYASTVTFRDIPEYMDVADQCRELGYPAIKLHAWGDARQDAQLIAALRERMGDEMDLMYDGSAGFDLADAIYVGRALTDSGYLWYEEPMREYSIAAHKALADRVDVPLLVAETSAGAHMNVADFIASGCASAVRTSAGLKGGVTGAMRIAHLADSFLLRAEVHTGGLVSAHLCMAIPNTTYYESLVTSSVVTREDVVGADGLVRASSAVGIGWEEQWARTETPAGLPA
ncbi:enolase C-terminal domain-like protein [Salinibacterium sp. NK8237]|uniref:enolase C-terminal domain-like protein n=1 Tax=Salinibacterium sp. NK8237 TaxID=2792038 RepID=UPI0018CF5681|nr:enolase C-terminal domain-like protein [Salinibacterium sp. NK8237]MBH0130628.1 hypothetical protein [Salinibacterium sp. NK8237]